MNPKRATPHLIKLRVLACVMLFGWVGLPSVRAEDRDPQTVATQIAAAYNAAMQAFNRGEWAAAAEGFEKTIALVTDPKDQQKLGPIQYTLGAAHFNAANYPKAAAAFKDYLAKFPTAPQAGGARLALARATFLSKEYEAAIPLFAQLESVPALREQALQAQAECYKELGKTDGQIGVMEKLIAPEIRTSGQAGSGLVLAQLYLDKNELPKVLDLINKLFARIDLVDNIVALNALTVKLGEILAENKSFPQALAAYRAVRTRDEVIAFQKDRIAAIDARMRANLDATRGNPQAYMAANDANNIIKARRDQAAQLLAEFEKLPDYMPGVIFRMGRVWYDWEKKWEAIVVFDRFRKDYPEAQEKEPAIYATLVCYADLGRLARTQKLGEEYLQEFPKGPNAATVGYLMGAVSLQAADPKGAATYFGTMLEKQSDSEYREQMRLGLGNALFMQNDFAKARDNYRLYLKDFPKGKYLEEARYREAMTTVFLGEYDAALGALRAYLQEYPKGAFAADAGYRAMVCKYAASLYDEVIEDGAKWRKDYPKNALEGEVLALLGDSFNAKDQMDEAVAAYTRSFQVATTDEVLNYSLFEASKLLQKLGKWAEVAEMFQDFVKQHPDHPTVVAAMFWIGKAQAHEGKTEEAKTFLVNQLEHYINDPKREAVEQLLQQLAQLCAKRPRPTATPTPPATPQPPVAITANAATPAPAPVPATPAPLPPYDAVGELRKQLAPLAKVVNSTGRARLLYAEAELAALRKQSAEVERIYTDLADHFKGEELSPVLLAKVGDFLLARGDGERAAQLYTQLRDAFPKSDYLDFAYVGLGERALATKEYKQALELFSYAADELAASKIKEATMGKARALLELGRYDEARPLFEQVASVREWRGESTAAALFSLGELEARQKRWPEAIAYYQRVFVAYQKYLPWMAKAYVESANAFESLGKRAEAIGHLKEMLRNEKLKDLPETTQAKKMLSDWGASA